MIEVEHLSKFYGSHPALSDLSFAVETGEILGLLGPNGAGKTTTMRILSGYLPASTGKARVAGYDVHAQSMAVRQRIGYLPETPPLYTEMTVEAYLHFVAQLKGIRAGDRPRQVDETLARCGLGERRSTIIGKLSKGYRQRVGIAQAIVHDPPVIILDEPTVGLDPRQIIEVRELIKSLAGRHTVVLSTHILPEVSMTCSKVTIINRGKLVTTNTPEQLMAELASGSGYELEVAGDRDRALRVLQGLPGVRSVQVLDRSLGNESDGDRLCYSLDAENPTDLGPQVAIALVQAGLDLHEMRRTRASLEDVFLRLTTQEAAQDVGQDVGQDLDDPAESGDAAAGDAADGDASAQAASAADSTVSQLRPNEVPSEESPQG